METLADKSHANQSHPKWLTQEDKEKVIQYKLEHPHLSSRRVAKALAKEGIAVTYASPFWTMLIGAG